MPIGMQGVLLAWNLSLYGRDKPVAVAKELIEIILIWADFADTGITALM